MVLAVLSSTRTRGDAPADASRGSSKPLADLAAKIHQIQDQKEKLPKVAVFDLASKMVEKPSDFSILGADPSAMTLRTLIDRLHKAREDKEIRCVLVTLGETATNLSQSQEIPRCADRHSKGR